MIAVFEPAFDLVADVRAAGVAVHQASDQQVFRRDVMLDRGYADHVDPLVLSCDLGGVAEPDPDHVEAARSVGIAAYRHDHHDSEDQGVGDLRELLGRAGVRGAR